MKRVIALWIAMGVIAASASGGGKVAVQVNGMVCAFCSQGLTKKFRGEPAVDAIAVDLDKKIVNVSLKDGQSMSDDRITTLIRDSGFTVEKITRE
jgi:copper chaperone CopZ